MDSELELADVRMDTHRTVLSKLGEFFMGELDDVIGVMYLPVLTDAIKALQRCVVLCMSRKTM